MPKLLITGATGLLGANLVRQAARPYEVTGWARSWANVPPGRACCCVDLTDRELTLEGLQELRPEVMIHCAAMTDVDRCENEPAAARIMNVDATRTLAEWSAQHGCHFVFISTDSVFDGQSGNFSEEERPAPVNEYARTKQGAEEAVRACRSDALILRTNFYGWNFKEKASLGEWMLEKLAGRERLTAFTDVRFNPLLVNDLAKIIFDLIARRAAGVFHAGARNECSKYEFALMLAEIFDLDASEVLSISIGDSALRAARPRNSTLKIEKLTRYLGREMPSVEEGLRSFKQLLDSGYVAALKEKQPEWLGATIAR